MLSVRKRIVTDEANRPVAVQIDYEDWCRIEQALRLSGGEAPVGDLSRFAGVLDWGEDGVAYQRRVRVFALSSRNEGFPGALIEAMEAGAAIVSTDCPFGPSEILDGGRFGRLVPVGDATLFAAALEVELDTPDVGPDSRRTERAEWMRQFDPEVITRRYLELIREVIGEGVEGVPQKRV